MNICILEPDEQNRELMTYSLKSSGFEAAGFSSSSDLLKDGLTPPGSAVLER